MVDESTDASNIERLVIFVNCVDKKMTVCEEYIDRMPATRTNADTIVVCINFRLRKNLRIQDTRGQCYDGCWTMNGTKNGIAA